MVRNSVQHRFGTRIRALRKAAGINQEDLAERCGMFRTYLSRLETGKANPTLTMIEALAGSLHVSIADLFSLSEPEPNPAAKKAPRSSRGRVSR